MFNNKYAKSTKTSLLLLISVCFTGNATDFQQQAFLTASNAEILDYFGSGSIAISGDTLVVGTPFEDSDATGVNGDENNNDAVSSGAVYVFTRTNDVWTQEAYLKASNTEAFDLFGSSVAISGDVLIVGAPFEDSNSIGIGGNEGNNDALTSGAAYIFTRSAKIWSQQAYIKASNTDANDQFGSAVAISGNKAVVGALHEDSDATGLNGDETNNDFSLAGAAYVFAYNSGVWHQEAYVKASNTGSFDLFGTAVAISGNTIVVGAEGEKSLATGVDGDENNDDAQDAGAAYVFQYIAGTWHQQAYLKASNTEEDDTFGFAVDVSANTVVVGALLEASGSVGVNSDGSNNDSQESGAAYVFTRNLGIWSQQAYLKASNTDDFDAFGTSVSISGNTLVVGALKEDGGASGIDGDDSNNDITGAGAAYVFTRNAGNWQQQHYLKSDSPSSNNNFAGQVDVSESTLVISEQGADFLAEASGAAYVFSQGNSYSVNVSVNGLLSAGLVLQNNGSDDLFIMNNGTAQFDTLLPDGSSYQVTISTQPNNSNHTCIIDGNSRGFIASAHVLIKVRCADFIFVDDFD